MAEASRGEAGSADRQATLAEPLQYAHLHRLEGIDPVLRNRVTRLLRTFHCLGHPMFVSSGFRTLEEQQTLYALGRTRPGKIVTYADGVRVPSDHQRGRAVDCAFLVDADHDGNVDEGSWDGQHPWTLYGHVARTLGLKWGGDWVRFKDPGHIYL